MVQEQDRSYSQVSSAERNYLGHHPNWPPQQGNTFNISQSPSFFRKAAEGSGRAVEWPPRQSSVERTELATEDVPCMMPLRQEVPITQKAADIYTSVPTIRNATPKNRGDLKWPPAGSLPEPEEYEPKPTIRPIKVKKSYQEFFAANQLPNNYPGYRAPPGTQHYGSDESDM